jgi:hypothetical protein
MNERELPLSDLKELAEEEIESKREEVGSESRARELLDVPSEDAPSLAREEQRE